MNYIINMCKQKKKIDYKNNLCEAKYIKKL